jgi:K+-transporting ATPase ATPase C chain
MKTISTALRIFLILTLLTGIAYPLMVTGITQLAFPSKANGSLLVHQNRVVGSKWIGQRFDSSAYFMSRPSAIAYGTLPSGGSNLGLTSSKLQAQVAVRKRQFLTANGLSEKTVVPSEMLFASASGLDPHISPESARLQVNRIAGARRLNAVQKQTLIQLIEQHTEKPSFHCLGEERVNVLLLNLSLDNLFH